MQAEASYALMKRLGDTELIGMVANGNLSAFEVLIDRYKDMVFTLCVRIIRNAEDAEETAQDVFLKAYQKLAEFEGKSKFSTWLYTIAYRSAISKIRKKQLPTNSIDDTDTHEVVISDSMTQLELLQEKDRKYYVQQALGNMEEDESALLTLYYLQELSVKEVAEIMDLTEANVKVKLFRARKRLHIELQNLLSDELKEMVK